MPRRSYGGRSALSPAARPQPSKTPSKPAASAPAPASAPVQSGNGFGAAIADGLLIHFLGPRVIKHETVASSEPAAAPAPTMNSVASSDACGGQSKALSDCLSNYGSDISKCQFYMDMLQECRRGSGAAFGA
ncbi:hypothetical protein DITRI_Ditri05aG0143000 [Diplodiscus trichospermus]